MPANLSGVSQVGDPLEWGPVTTVTAERQHKASLDQWRGAASRYSPDELEREIYATNLSDVDSLLQEALARYHISLAEFAQLGEFRRLAFLEGMPWQRTEMHSKRQWAKNADVLPRDSDLIDRGFLSLVVSYCDIVVTEKQTANLFSRGVNTRATIVSQLSHLPELAA